MKKARTKHGAEFKARVALEAVREQQSLVELSRRYQVHTNAIAKWKYHLLKNASVVFESAEGSGIGEVAVERQAELLQKIGELTVERDFLAKGLGRSR